MRGHTIRRFQQVGHSYPGPDAHTLSLEAILRNAATGIAGWLLGIQFLAGWHVATVGSFNYPTDAAYGIVGAVLSLAAAAIACSSGVRLTRARFGFAVVISLLLIVAALPLGALFGSVWNSTFGAFPHITGLGDQALP